MSSALSGPPLNRVAAVLDARNRVSPGRLCGPSCSRTLEAYAWELQIAGACSESLKHVERALRGALTRELCGLAGRADWWASPGIRLHGWAECEIAKAREQLRRQGKAITPQTVTARLTFGFWTSLLGNASGADYETRLWRPALHRAFPGYRGLRRNVYQRVEFLRKLRNRADHPDDEPIGDADLEAALHTVELVLGWIDPAAATWVLAISRVPDVLSARPNICGGCRPMPRQRPASAEADRPVRRRP